jgi:predicted transcriptional regulator
MPKPTISAGATNNDKVKFINHLLDDVSALEYMLENNMFETGIERIGAEQEFCLVKNDMTPSNKAIDILNSLNDPYFTTELAKYNLELNLPPLELKGDCFSEMEKFLLNKMDNAYEVAKKHGNSLVLTGILPTISHEEITSKFMTPLNRYTTLGKIIKEARGSDFELHLEGVDELNMKHNSIMLEACNTSFQVHLQIEPKEFVEKYNWALAISGPVLSAVANSPLLLGNELWRETRIAVFQQSIDVRATTRMPIKRQSRVSFGTGWIKKSVAEIYKDDISRYTLLITNPIEESSLELLKRGEVPKLEALRLHNGTVYKWNRPCYGISNGKPHLRIENRYIPSGPSVRDEMANSVFWIGLMKGMPEKYKEIWKVMDFKQAKGNFIKAAKFGLETEFEIFDKILPARDLILENLLPMAEAGLKKAGVSQSDIDTYLGVIEKRIIYNQTGSQWIIRNFRKTRKLIDKDSTLKLLTLNMMRNGYENIPVCDWKEIDSRQKIEIQNKFEKVSQVMSTDLFVVRETDMVQLVLKIMEWRNINRMPVEGIKGQLVGLLTMSHIKKCIEKDPSVKNSSVKEVMIKDVFVIGPDDKLINAIDIMNEKQVGCLPVLRKKTLIGIITETDLMKIMTENDSLNNGRD